MDYWGDLTVPIALFVYSLSFCFVCFFVYFGVCRRLLFYFFLLSFYRTFWGTRGAGTL